MKILDRGMNLMSSLKQICPALAIGVCMLLYGCGDGTSGNVVAVAKQQEAAICIGCHDAVVSPGTGKAIAEEWKLSGHNTRDGASCKDCHEPKAGHPNYCNGCHNGPVVPRQDEVVRNPDSAGKCFKCHGLSFPNDAMLKNAPQHFGNMTASINNSGYRASYVSSMYAGNCRKCHNPHKPIALDAAGNSIHAQWARSAHGDPVSRARQSRDFKTAGTFEPVNLTVDTICVRCHTTTGFIKYVTSGFNDLTPFAGPGYPVVKFPAPSTDKSKEATNCDVCHDNYSFRVRPVPPVRVYYNFSSTKQSRGLYSATTPSVKLNNNPRFYPDAGPSNLCVTCHSGRATGKLIHDAVTLGADFTNISLPSGHVLAAGGTVFRGTGYEFPGRNYDSSASGFLHDRIGMNNTNGTGNQGPCITCHLKSSQSHSFLPVTFDTNGVIINGIKSFDEAATCGNGGCHDGGVRPVWSAATLQAKRFGFHTAMTILNQLLINKGVTNSGVQYYQRDAAKNGAFVTFNGVVQGTAASIIANNGAGRVTNDWVSAVLTPEWAVSKNWWNNPSSGATAVTSSPVTRAPDTPDNRLIAANTMGALFNYNMFLNEFGAYVHNDLYMRRLIYDSIDWIDDGNLNDSVASTLATPVAISTGSGAGTSRTQDNRTEPGTKGRIYTASDLTNITQTAREWLFGSGTSVSRP